jgi:hypothetical protein
MTRWLEFPVDRYLDQRHPNWVLAEEFGDVRFSGEAVFVHRERAEHIARMLLGGRDVLALEDALALPAGTAVGVVRLPPPQARPLVIERSSTRWRDIVGWLDILVGAAVFVAALVVPLGDPALLAALAILQRGGGITLTATTSGPDTAPGGS